MRISIGILIILSFSSTLLFNFRKFSKIFVIWDRLFYILNTCIIIIFEILLGWIFWYFFVKFIVGLLATFFFRTRWIIIFLFFFLFLGLNIRWCKCNWFIFTMIVLNSFLFLRQKQFILKGKTLIIVVILSFRS